MAEPARRAFLPRAVAGREGRWQWYRSWMLDRAPIGFIREGDGTSLDQPTVMERLRMLESGRGERFAAVLGDPVAHSWTPAEQFEFFARRGMPVLAIDLGEDEWKAARSTACASSG